MAGLQAIEPLGSQYGQIPEDVSNLASILSIITAVKASEYARFSLHKNKGSSLSVHLQACKEYRNHSSCACMKSANLIATVEKDEFGLAPAELAAHWLGDTPPPDPGTVQGLVETSSWLPTQPRALPA